MTTQFACKAAPTTVLLGIVLLLLAGCGGPPACMQPQPYMKAKSYPKIKIPPGLKQVASNDAMTIPKVPKGPIGQYKKAPANTAPDNPAARCLTTPPPLPKSVINMSKSGTGS